MVTYMNDKKIQTLDEIRAFLEGTVEVEFSITNKDERYRWIRTTLVRFHYLTLGRTARGLVLRYLRQVSGYSRQTITRLVAQYRKNGKIQRRQRTVAGFQRYYTPQDARLLAELDELHGVPCGAAAKKLCERMYQVHGDARFEALSHISVSHLYNLRHSSGYLRVDTVHQGDLDGIKGKVKKRYPYEAMKTPYDKLKSLPEADTFLKPGITFDQLDAIALAISDNEAAKQMNEAKHKLFKTIFEQDRKVG